jgi:hypothetical protein
MRSRLYWEEFAEATITRLMRPEPGDPLLIITDTSNDMNLAEAYLAAGLRAGADTHGHRPRAYRLGGHSRQ